MAIFDNIINDTPAYSPNFAGYTGNPPTTEAEYNALNCWKDSSIAPTWADIQAKFAELETKKQAEIDAKASALAKLAALGLTQDEVKSLIG